MVRKTDLLVVQEFSPAEDSGLRAKNDFIITSLNIDYYDIDDFAQIVYNLSETVSDFRLKLVVYNMFHEEMRIVVIKPHRDWDGDGLLGVEFGAGLVNDFRRIQTAYKKARDDNTEDLDSNPEEALEDISLQKEASMVSNVGSDVNQGLEIQDPEATG